jgi:membrane protein
LLKISVPTTAAAVFQQATIMRAIHSEKPIGHLLTQVKNTFAMCQPGPFDRLTNVANRLRTLWTLGGLSLSELLRRTARESWEDAVFGQGSRMAFYQFLAIFPALVVFLALSGHVAQGHNGAFHELTRQILPGQVRRLLESTAADLGRRRFSDMQLVSVCVAAFWAALNGTWAMIWGLNRAYEVQEHRSWFHLGLTIVGLTFYLAVVWLFGLFVVFLALQSRTLTQGSLVELRTLEWVVLIVLLSLSFAVLYRFAPSVPDHKWRWSTPGAACGLILWIGATLAARAYFDYVNDYSTTYGHLNGVVILLLWLYVTNGAILIGGEMNSEIEKNAEAAANAPKGRPHQRGSQHIRSA